jgi:DNA repair photolyase
MNISIRKGFIREVTIREVEAKSILRKHKKIDSWFISRCGMNLYRGCTHGCVYCDGRAQGYRVEGEFGKDVEVKVNAIELLRRELDPKRRRSVFRPGFIMLGGGVSDSYQPVEKKYELTGKALQLAYEHDLPVHMLTKSTLIERDLDLLKRINEKNRAIVSFSFSSVDKRISRIFEPGVPSPEKRLETLAVFKREGISTGMFLLPVIPFITDKPELMEESIRAAKEAGVDFVIFGGMTLKEGRQKDFFSQVLEEYFPDLVACYQMIYSSKSKWGEATKEYYDSLNLAFDRIAARYEMPKRVPPGLFQDILDPNDLVIVILEHIDYLLKLKGRRSPYGYAAYSISQLKEPLSAVKKDLRKLKGVGPTTERLILEILGSGNSEYYQKLLHG